MLPYDAWSKYNRQVAENAHLQTDAVDIDEDDIDNPCDYCNAVWLCRTCEWCTPERLSELKEEE